MSKVRIPLIFTFAGMFFVTVAIAQLVGLWRIQHIDAGRRRQVSEHQRHVAAYRRLSPFGEHRDENAALWYRLAFQHFKGIRVDDFVEVRRLVSDADSASEKMRGVFRQRCKEVEEVRVRNALMCTRCDWGLNYSLEPTQLFDNPRQAGIVGECLLLRGRIQEADANWVEAARSYMEALAFASDLGAGDLLMNLYGIVLAEQGSDRLRSLLERPSDISGIVAEVGAPLRSMPLFLPAMTVGLRGEALWLEYGLIAEARAEILQKSALNVVFPCGLLAAWHLSKNIRVIDRFGEAIKLRDAHRREDEAAAIRGLVANTRSVILREGFPVKFNSILVSAEYVRRTHRLLVAILELDEFRQQHGRYPPTDGVQQRDYSEVGYRVAADGMSYTLAVEKPDGTVVSFARRHQ